MVCGRRPPEGLSLSLSSSLSPPLSPPLLRSIFLESLNCLFYIFFFRIMSLAPILFAGCELRATPHSHPLCVCVCVWVRVCMCLLEVSSGSTFSLPPFARQPIKAPVADMSHLQTFQLQSPTLRLQFTAPLTHTHTPDTHTHP